MNKLLHFKIIFFAFIIISFQPIIAQAPEIEWQKSYGGSGWDDVWAIKQRNDGGYIVAGHSDSNDGDVIGNKGFQDYWILKLDPSGNIEWQRSFGGSNGDLSRDIHQTPDGGYIVGGDSASIDGDVNGSNGLYFDFWIVKLDSLGNIEWSKTIGGSRHETLYSIQVTADHGYILAGASMSSDGDVSSNKGGNDGYIVKLNVFGDIEWTKSLGTSGDDRVWSIKQTADGGYITTGFSCYCNSGFHDTWVIRLDANGELMWEKIINSGIDNFASDIQQTPDGGFLLAGTRTFEFIMHNLWIVKLDSSGDVEWEKISEDLNGPSDARAVELTTDGGYVVAGWTNSSTDTNLPIVYWVLKYDSNDNLEWKKILGGSGADVAQSIQQTTDGGFIIAGNSTSNDGDVSENKGFSDYWIVKLEGTDPVGTIGDISIYPNPVTDILNITTSNGLEIKEILLFDIIGKYLDIKYIDQTMDLTGLASGFYTLIINTNQKQLSHIIIKK